ncbi:hypothetical protein [Pseudidiomarina insulisalsae]|uniref:Flagellar biosynthesis protein FlhF n=1 Tax=Pseudidiomarina insulisalsae TaxID=575789 RepID=A0A432YDR1_9GAMM|nr:hypothetical protein [Pseudidiomarina insulisalsae]RUO59071.1 hypothetical protein CWI71_09645 [Pseudidiomarina insulisalsae]
MTLQRFVAPTQREAMRHARAQLGDDAIIVTTRSHASGAEVFALREQDLDQIDNQRPVASQDDITTRLMQDMQALRALVQERMADSTPTSASRPTAGRNTAASWCYAKLAACGFSASVQQQLVAKAPQTDSVKEMQRWLQAQLEQRICAQQAGTAESLLEHQGVVAVVGPTGVGKTTTTAKLAAQFVMRYGPEQLLLVTTDSYRIGAQQQLGTYADLLGVELAVLGGGQDSAAIAAKAAGKRLVLIDTVGLSQRDQRLTERLAELGGPQWPNSPRLLLLLNAAAQQSMLAEVAGNYQAIARQLGWHLGDVLLTKLDEATCLGAVVDTVLRYDLRIQGYAAGQRVPEDLEFQRDAGDLAAASLSLEAPAVLSPGTAKRGLLSEFAQVQQLAGQLARQLQRQQRASSCARYYPSGAQRSGWRTEPPVFALDAQLRPIQAMAPSAELFNAAELQLFATLPSAATLTQLTQTDCNWFARLRHQQHLTPLRPAAAADRKIAVRAWLRREGMALDNWVVRWQGQRCQARLRVAALASELTAAPLQLFQLSLRGPTRALQQERYFVASSQLSAQTVQCACQALLELDELARLTRLAWQKLDQADTQHDLQQPAGIAALAVQLAYATSDALVVLREQLMRLGQRTGVCRPGKLIPQLTELMAFTGHSPGSYEEASRRE